MSAVMVEAGNFTPEHVRSMAVNQVFYTDTLFAGITDQKIKWTVMAVAGTKKAPVYSLRASYFGITISKFTISLKKGTVVLNDAS